VKMGKLGQKRQLIPPPATWRPDLIGTMRADSWRLAAGLNENGGAKTIKAHINARQVVLKKEAIRIIKSKAEGDRTPDEIKSLQKHQRHQSIQAALMSTSRNNKKEALSVATAKSVEERTEADITIIKDDITHKSYTADYDKAYRKIPAVAAVRHDARKAWRQVPENKENERLSNLARSQLPENREQKRLSGAAYNEIPENREKQRLASAAWREIPENRENHRIANAAWRVKKRQKKDDGVITFILYNAIQVNTVPRSHAYAFNYIVELLDDKDSVIGSDLYKKLGMTLMEAFWDGKFDGAIYPHVARGQSSVGDSTAEYIQFLVRTSANNVLTRADNGDHFKYTDKQFKDLGVTFCPIFICNSYGDVTTMESAFQLIFDFLTIGRHRLWKQSGAGRFPRALRTCDIKYIKESGDKEPRFMFGLTILKNVSVVERTIDANGRDVVSAITAGLGVKCKVNQPLRDTPICNAEQRTALEAAREKLPPNFMQRERALRGEAPVVVEYDEEVDGTDEENDDSGDEDDDSGDEDDAGDDSGDEDDDSGDEDDVGVARSYDEIGDEDDSGAGSASGVVIRACKRVCV
jgi:hypothetical protein